METGSTKRALRQIEALYTVGTLGGVSDAQLLERFIARSGDDAEDAFAALVRRHGPMVMGVCRRMLPQPYDWEDAFQATFLVLARRAASIGRREQLASWLYGVAVRTARQARRQAARQRERERRLMNATQAKVEAADDRDDLLALLDEELNALPERYRAALIACELQGQSRRAAAQALGLPEGTLSSHLARGRKLLRERLRRRGVVLGVAPVLELAPQAALPERLVEPTARAAVRYASPSGEPGNVPAAAAALAERVLKMMLVHRVTALSSMLLAACLSGLAAVVLGMGMLAVGSPVAEQTPGPAPDDLPGRVIDKTGAGVADVPVWVIETAREECRTIATATTDAQGRFVLPHIRDVQPRKPEASFRSISIFARAQDGRIGWVTIYGRNLTAMKQVELELGPDDEVRGRVVDHNGQPIASAVVATTGFWKPSDQGWNDMVQLSPEAATPFQATTGTDGSFVLKGILKGAMVTARINTQQFGSPSFSWDSTQSATIRIDNRIGQIKGRLKPPDDRELSGRLTVEARSISPLEGASSHAPERHERRAVEAGKDGSFQFDDLPPGRYSVNAWSSTDAPFTAKPLESVEVGPNAVVHVEIPLLRLARVTGRVVDAQTGKGLAEVPIQYYYLAENHWTFQGDKTDADGRFSILVPPGMTKIQPNQLPKAYLPPQWEESPALDVKADQTWPDIKIARAASLDGVVVDVQSQPVANASVYLLALDRPGVRHPEPVQTGPGGEFHFDQIDPNDKVSLWARAGDATSDGTIVLLPDGLKGKVKVTIHSKFAARIRGQATDAAGKPIAGARVMLRWTRPLATLNTQVRGRSVGNLLDERVTSHDGQFDFRGLWAGLQYHVEIQARGYSRSDAPDVTGQAGQTHDLGNVILTNTSGYLAGRVVGSDGQPIAGAAVFNRGDGPERVATSTDAQGQFRLDGLYPGMKYLFIRKDGYRFTGVRSDADADGLTIILLKSTEPPPPWKPGPRASYEAERAFAKQVLIRIWEKFGANADKNGAFSCIEDMALFDPHLALRWSAERGHRYDDRVARVEARVLAETDAAAALEILNRKIDWPSQAVLQELAERFAESDPQKAHLFAQEAAVRSRAIGQPERAVAMAQAGSILVRLGRGDVGRKLIEEAAHDASQFASSGRQAYFRGLVAQALAPFDEKRALGLVEPTEAKQKDRYLAFIAGALATIDTPQAVALADQVGGNAFYHEMVKTEIAYKIGAERPDEAIKIIEGIKRDLMPYAPWQAEAFGWLAVAVAPRDRTRAFGLIDRALAMMIDQRDWAARSASSGGEMAVAAHIAECAQRIGYPDMDSVIMRVLAARPVDNRPYLDRSTFAQSVLMATVPLALIDPAAARSVLEQVEARAGFDPSTHWRTGEPWLLAWSLIDLKKAEALFEAQLAALDPDKEQHLWADTGFFKMVELLANPPDRRADELGESSYGASWRPGQQL